VSVAIVLSLAHLGVSEDVYCEAGYSMTRVTLNSGDRFVFATLGDNYDNRIKCTAIYKLGSCKRVIVNCPKFETKVNSKKSKNSCRGDKLLLTQPTKKMFCSTSGPSDVSITKSFKMKFISNKKFNAKGIECVVQCADAVPEPTTPEPEPTTPESKDCMCGLAQRVNRIIGGEETEVNEYPWQVAMYYKNYFMCGGSVISDRWVLSAAHCVTGGKASNYKLVLGEHDRFDGEETTSHKVSVEKIISHELYDGQTYENDLALLKLAKPIDFASWPHVRPVCLPSGDAGDFEGMLATISGWGTTTSGGYLSPVLMDVQVEVLSNSDCQNNYGYSPSEIYEDMLCAGVSEGGKDSCQGDSGGPLVSSDGNGMTPGENYDLIGVVSWGYGCANPNYPGVYARVTEAMEWIEDNTEESFNTCPRTLNETTNSTPKPTEATTPKPTEAPTPKPTEASTPKPTEAPTPKPTEQTETECNCGLAQRATRIVGGTETEINEYPWQVAMYFGGNFRCGASLISDRWVLSAAHCISSKNANSYKLVLGEHQIGTSDDTESYSMLVEKVIVHGSYNEKTLNNDYALLKLKDTIDFTKFEHIRPVCLPSSDAGDFDGLTAVVSGWGTTSSGGSLSKVLLEAEVEVLSNKECISDYGYTSSDLTTKMMCAGVEEGGKDACQGDSGGPLVTCGDGDGVTPGENYDLIGVVSWGYGCASARFPGVYARVTEVIDWIEDNTEGTFNTCPRKGDSSSGTTAVTTPKPSPEPTAEPETTESPASSCKCGLAQRGTRIIGGNQTEVNEYPWQVAMYYGGRFICGGSVISSRWVLSAAHCVTRGTAKNYKLRLGEHHRWDSDEVEHQTMNVKEIISHEKYSGRTYNNDYALLELEEAIDFKKYPHIRPVCLPELDDGDFSGEMAIVTGWGSTGNGLSSVLMEVEVEVLSNSACKNDYGYASSDITDQMVCAAVEGGGKDACQGDSGGPMVTSSGGDGETPGQNYDLIGVVSWGYGCAYAQYPGVYARLTEALKWIDNNTGTSFTTCPRE